MSLLRDALIGAALGVLLALALAWTLPGQALLVILMVVGFVGGIFFFALSLIIPLFMPLATIGIAAGVSIFGTLVLLNALVVGGFI